MARIDLGAISVAYTDEGTGEPLVLVHGHPFDRSMWAPQVERFAGPDWRVIAPDLRGYGETTVVPGKTFLETFARDLGELLDRLGVGRIVLGGLSMGGQIVMEFHRLFPSRVRGLVLADTSPVGETSAGKRLRNETADRLLREGLAPYADEVLPKMVAPHNLEALPEVGKHVLGMMRGAPAEGAAAALRGRAERLDYVESLGTVEVPTLIVVGSDDEYTPVADAELMHRRIRGSRLVVVDGAAHMPNLERRDEFDGALEAFLSSVAGGADGEVRFGS
ncbi:alpha/beta fold hydrolase [Amycolatopsis sp. YIM 10]|uniref:alpha/beta fold hydrolase n=1 Tax=Amycolatopsis sp. YIM 10 TaxID=2653857 RepID=UPI00128FE8FB|nr:alpha/beta hydrolase [Amycolatopsis sp. YIM 10]QFU86051.1 3-oxoadipate enol-lactonase 2 [Amycolatopsis sp. YIM 10]